MQHGKEFCRPEGITLKDLTWTPHPGFSCAHFGFRSFDRDYVTVAWPTEGIERLLAETFGPDYSSWIDVRSIPKCGAGVAVLYQQESDPSSIGGIIFGRPKGALNASGGLAVWRIDLLAARSGLGIGGRLLTRFLSEAQSKGAKTVLADTDPERTKAIAFYQKHGFIDAGRVEGFYFYNGHPAPAVFLRKDL